jgi:hypothetical protein
MDSRGEIYSLGGGDLIPAFAPGEKQLISYIGQIPHPCPWGGAWCNILLISALCWCFKNVPTELKFLKAWVGHAYAYGLAKTMAKGQWLYFQTIILFT